MKRRSMGYKRSKRLFKKTAKRTDKRNVTSIPRGGYRL